MKLTTKKEDFDSLQLYNQLFLALWREEKGYPDTKEFSYGEIVELALAISPDFRFDTPAERTTFNNSLQYNELFIGWDGAEPINILWYEMNEKLKKKLHQYMMLHSK